MCAMRHRQAPTGVSRCNPAKSSAFTSRDSEAFLLVRDDGSPAVIETVSGNEKPPMAKHVV